MSLSSRLLNLVSFTKLSSDSGLNLTVCVSNSSNSLSAHLVGIGREWHNEEVILVSMRSYLVPDISKCTIAIRANKRTIKVVGPLIYIVSMHLA